MTNYMNPEPGARPPLGTRFFNWLRSLGVRRGDDRWIGGVCSGVAARIGWDPLLVRIIWFATLFLGGFGLAAYGFAWMALPDGRDGTILAEDLVHGRLRGAFVMAVLFVLIGLPATTVLIPVLAIGLVCALIVAVFAGSRDRDGARQVFADGSVGTAGPGAGTGAPRNPGTTNPYAYSQTPSPQPNPYAGGPADGSTGGPMGSPYTGNPYAGQPYAQRPVPQPSQPTEVRRPAGPVVSGLMYGLVLISLALAVLWQMFVPDYVPGGGAPSLQLWVLGVTVFTGVVLIVLGLRGRRTGGLMPLAVIALVLASMVAGGVQIRASIADGSTGTAASGRDVTFANVTYSTRDYNRYGLETDGLEATFSDVTLDLSDWEDVTGHQCPTGSLETDVTFSTLTVVLPEGCSVSTAGMQRTFGGTGAIVTSSGDDTGDDTLYLNGDVTFGTVMARQAPPTVGGTTGSDPSVE